MGRKFRFDDELLVRPQLKETYACSSLALQQYLLYRLLILCRCGAYAKHEALVPEEALWVIKVISRDSSLSSIWW